MENQGSILVVGADGQIGRSLADRLSGQGRTVVRTMLQADGDALPLDLSRDAAGWVPPRRISVAYLCAAVTSIDYCRQHPAEAYAVNVRGTMAVARRLAEQQALVVFLSSNLVFDGSAQFEKPDAPRRPGCEYGRHKAEVEEQLLLMRQQSCIVRFTKVLGLGMPLLAKWRGALQQKQPIHPFSDMVMAPVPLTFAVDVLRRVGEVRRTGVVQVSASQDVTYEQVARHLAKRIGADEGLVKAVRAADSGLDLGHVPAHTTLDTTVLREELGMVPPDVWQTIDGLIEP